MREEAAAVTRPIYGLTVLRYEDGRTEVKDAWDDDNAGHVPELVPMPAHWEHRHKMLIDALGVVKREAGIDHE